MPAKVVAHRYELGKILGEGGMGIVYQARDIRTNGLVAIKTLKNASDPETLTMFHKEWGELVHLSHANIVGVRDVGEFEENGRTIPFFVMPLLPGGTLASLIKAKSPILTVETVIEIICQVCRGLNFAHEKGLIHRDLKPSNIFVNDDGTAQIIDFGLVQSSNSKTETGFKGTLQYMAPEQTEGKKVGRASDIFSLGIVAYEALTGKQPFWRPDKADTVDAVRRLSPPPISELNPRVSDLLSKAIHVAMAKQPIHRYSSAKEFADTLQKALHDQPIERFDAARIQPKIARARAAFERADHDFASDLLMELEAEGHVDPQITLLRAQVEESTKQKWIRNLFEAAQTRLEQNEIPLALAKLSEILKIDPENAQALAKIKAIDDQVIQEEYSGWMKLAKQHLDRNDFSGARKDLDEAIKLRYDEPEALRLRAEIEVREKDAAKVRQEKEKLYSAALRANEGGELSSAISSLEKLIGLNRAAPAAAIPERDKVYTTFYNNMVAERDGVDNAYAEANRLLNEKAFDSSLHVCDRILTKYPNNAQFKALRIKVEGAQRQDLSSYIVEVGKAVDSEPNLDRRVALLEEASKNRPNEQQFTRQLKLAREHRDLVASILAKARSNEEQEQFGEAIQQWKILQNTHPLYVGADSQISQLEARRERQINDEKKNRWTQRIDQALDNFAYAEALRLTAEALYDFPADPELVGQEKLAKQGLDRILNAERFFDEAKTAKAAAQPDDAIALLQNALKEDGRHFAARSMLINLLTEQAQSLLDINPRKAETLAQAAREVDPEHPSVKRITSVLAEKRRVDAIAQYLSSAREVQNTDVAAAWAIIEKALAEFPGDSRLLQYRGTLPAQQPRVREVAAPGDVPNERTKLYQALGPDDRSRFLDNTMAGLAQTVTQIPTPPPPPPPSTPKPILRPNEVRSKEPPKPTPKPPAPKGPSQFQLSLARWQAQAQSASKSAFAFLQKLSLRHLWTTIGISLAALAAIIGVVYKLRTPEKVIHVEPQVRVVDVNVTTQPANAELRVDDVPYPERKLSLRNDKSHPVKVSLLGFKTMEATKSVSDNWSFKLSPEPLHLNIATNDATGSVFYDDHKLGDLADGSFTNDSIIPDSAHHVISVKSDTAELFHVAFQAVPGARPLIDALAQDELTVAASLGNKAGVYSGTPQNVFPPDGQSPRPVDKAGIDFDLDGTLDNNAGPSDVELKLAKGKKAAFIVLGRGNAPVLSIKSTAGVNVDPNFTVSTPVKNAVLFLDGSKKRAERFGRWALRVAPGDHKLKLTAPGMNDEERTVTVPKTRNFATQIQLTPLARFATIVMKNGTPFARVLMDQQPIGELDSNGSLTYAKVPPGDHTFTLEKEGFAPLSSRQILKENEVLQFPGNLLLSKATGHVTISVSAPNAKVEYSAAGKNDWHPATLPTISLPPGSYDFAASAPGFHRLQKPISVDALKSANLDFALQSETQQPPPVASFLAGLPDLVSESNWFSSSANSWISVPSGITECSLIFLRQDRYPAGRRRPKRFEWSVITDADSVSYVLDGHGLTRKSKVANDKDSATIAVTPTDNLQYAFRLILDAHGVQLKSKDGTMLDDFKTEGHDWTHARIRVKADAFFDVRR